MNKLDSGFRRNDGKGAFPIFYERIRSSLMKQCAWKTVLFLSAVTITGIVAAVPGHSQDWASVKE
ncbi:MAG: hypothetical protein NTY44_07200, partial [Deltaproteobacteria bacterium]|nr:hypothetical protein [Deltaproteobacteria bacterium]